MICGNGGSAADSEHIAGELLKAFVLKRPVCDKRIPDEIRDKLQLSLPAISLTSQSAIFTAYINDVDPQMIYAQLVYGYASSKDLILALSTSGNSVNVVNAVKVAKAIGAKTVAFTGEQGGMLSDLCNVTINVPESETYKVQEYHLPIYHYLCQKVEKHFFNE